MLGYVARQQWSHEQHEGRGKTVLSLAAAVWLVAWQSPVTISKMPGRILSFQRPP
jgi:hypothetical protein